jgi:hypothetical protein
MYMIHKQGNSIIVFLIHRQALLLLPLLHKLMVELDEQKRLVLYVREKVVLTDEVEHIWASESQEERERFAWLAVGDVSKKYINK